MWKTCNMIYSKALTINADIYHIHDPELIRIGLKLIQEASIEAKPFVEFEFEHKRS